MPYAVTRGGRLEFRPNTGNGPCNRRLSGLPFRRVLAGVHVTKGTHHDPDTVPNPRAAAGRLPAPPPGSDLSALERRILSWQRAKRNAPRASVPGGARRRQEREATG